MLLIGGGAIGTAIARSASLKGLECFLLEKNRECGMETSSRSSEVIHSGIYYKPGSLKAKLCVKGQQLMVSYLKERKLPHEMCGKLLVACSEADASKLAFYLNNGKLNGLTQLELWGREKVSSIEPSLQVHSAVWSPYTGIFSSHDLLQSLLADIACSPSTLITNCSFLGAKKVWYEGKEMFQINTTQGELLSDWLINAAGLHAQHVARSIADVPHSSIPPSYFAKGNYFKLVNNRNAFRHLIYPLPEEGGLGVHATLDLSGSIRFGPDVEWIKSVTVGKDEYLHPLDSAPQLDYSVSSLNLERFVSEIAKYWPNVLNHRLEPDYSGIRPKIQGPGSGSFADFVIQDETVHGVKNLIQLFGMESPGWTASLAVGEYVSNRLVQYSY